MKEENFTEEKRKIFTKNKKVLSLSISLVVVCVLAGVFGISNFITVDKYSKLNAKYRVLLAEYNYLENSYSILTGEHTDLKLNYNELSLNYNELLDTYMLSNWLIILFVQ